MKTLKYQQRAIEDLVEKTIDLLEKNGQRHKIVFQAPTGSGKTVMASEMLRRLGEELTSRSDCLHHDVAYIWIAPNKLHQQSYRKMKEHFAGTRMLRTVMFDELDHSVGYLQAGEILFVNWESINKDNAVMVRDNEQCNSLYRITDRTQRVEDIPIVCIIDEEHMFGGRNAKKSEIVLRNINPKIELRISATPITVSGQKVYVDRQDVIGEQMIKESIILNPCIGQHHDGELTLNQYLTREALNKRDELAEAYRKAGAAVNPLLLIQLPNDTSEAMSNDEVAIVEEVKAYLKVLRGITVENGRLAIWLSKEKTPTLDGIERMDNMTEVLLFKQAIALGWDCPRAAVLLIFRRLESFTFTTQTVGRIMRMPEQHFYADTRLNMGYVYTDLSRDKIQIVADDMAYMSTLRAVRREGLTGVTLTSSYQDRPSAERNRLGSDFKRTLREVIAESFALRQARCEWEADGEMEMDESAAVIAYNRSVAGERLKLDVRNVVINLPENVTISDVPATIDVSAHAKFVRTQSELRRTLEAFCRQHIGDFEKVHSTGVLRGALVEMLEVLFGIFETEAAKVILYHANRGIWADIIDRAVGRYAQRLAERKQQAAERSFATAAWEVPEERIYTESGNAVEPRVKNHALMPYIRALGSSQPEVEFAAFLERNIRYVDWWYKNGDAGRQHFAVPYVNKDGGKALFYVDFIVRMKSGQVYLFDTKTRDSDPNGAQKNNGLYEYIREHRADGLRLTGGVIIRQGENWYYPDAQVSNISDISPWKRLDLSQD